jgi:acyl carrier protein phosphodiesterase
LNYLAHLYLADDSPDTLVGALLGDFVKGAGPHPFSPGILAGIALHQHIDRFTDGHPIVQRSKARVAPARRRFAGILVDVFYDHYLASAWASYTDEPLTQFSQRVYRVLETYESQLPQRLQQVLPALVHQDWLMTYATQSGIALTLERMSRRLKRVNPLAEGIQDLEQHYGAIALDFHEFFPELRAFVEGFAPQ